jgi:hypothetical protein
LNCRLTVTVGSSEVKQLCSVLRMSQVPEIVENRAAFSLVRLLLQPSVRLIEEPVLSSILIGILAFSTGRIRPCRSTSGQWTAALGAGAWRASGGCRPGHLHSRDLFVPVGATGSRLQWPD